VGALAGLSETLEGVSAELNQVGYSIIPGVLETREIDVVRDALEPHLAGGRHGRNDFEGFSTQRVYSLIAKSRAFDRLVLDPCVLSVTERVLGVNFLLTAALAINLLPGETAQAFHYDDAFYPIPRPRPPISLSAMWAIDEFSTANGATVIHPASHLWPDGPPAPGAPVVTAAMSPGSVLLYLGTLVHAGGGNSTNDHRLGISIQYTTAWARQQENFMVALGTDGARQLPARLQELIGYSIHPPFMGMINGLHPRRLLE
jgi:ectoine hydroxylase-related dioxygenase (phytanoyl-CoA dioxygenase family)